MGVVMDVAEQVVVLDFGRKIADDARRRQVDGRDRRLSRRQSLAPMELLRALSSIPRPR